MHRFAKPLPSAHRRRLIATRADSMRSAPTLSEARLWVELSGCKLGAGFRRQVPVGGRFIADFLAPALSLIVEVDGGIHERTRRADARRDESLRYLGYRIVRVDARLVLTDIEAALARVRAAIEAA